jgi:glutamine amidotransferase
VSGGAPSVVVMDHGSGNVRSAVRALERAGADVTLTADQQAAMQADGLVVPGVGAFASVTEGIRAVDGEVTIGRRLAGGRPVLGICVGLQVLFEASTEPGAGDRRGLGQWPGTVRRLPAERVPHMGWNTVRAAPGSRLFEGIEDERFYFVHSYAVLAPDQAPLEGRSRTPSTSPAWATSASRAPGHLRRARRGAVRGGRGERRAVRDAVPSREVGGRRGCPAGLVGPLAGGVSRPPGPDGP